MTLGEAIEALVMKFVLRLYGRKVYEKLAAQSDFTPEQEAIIIEVLSEPVDP